MKIEEVTAFLYSLNPKGIRFGLQNTLYVLEKLGNPQGSYPSVHLAGSNGKGSTAAFLESMTRQKGIRTGLYTSPHLVHFSERFRIDGTPVDNATICRAAERLLTQGLELNLEQVLAWLTEKDMVRRMNSKTWYAERGYGSDFCRLTFFECTTIMAMLIFEQAQVNLAIVETGMGGRLDATNVLDPKVSVITPVHLEHTAWLGDTVEKIAGEKAGIIKTGIPVVCAKQHPDAKKVIQQVATEKNSPIDWVGLGISISGDFQQATFTTRGQKYGPVRLGLSGPHQVHNAALAIGCLHHLNLDLSRKQVEQGLEQVSWPGRFERLGQWILDGAHNPDGARVLAQTVHQVLGPRKVRLLFGVLGDKEAVEMLKTLEPLAQEVHLVKPNDARGRDPREWLGSTTQKAHVHATMASALASLDNDKPTPVLITGSLTIVGEARQWLRSRKLLCM
jgi:dihydrofolate synthase/folylpolyglutamate synthase